MGIRMQLSSMAAVRAKFSTKSGLTSRAPTLMWKVKPGNLGSFFGGFTFSKALDAYDSSDAIERYSIIEGSLPPGLVMNQYSAEIEGVLPALEEPTTYEWTIRVKTYDNRILYGTYSMQVVVDESQVQWVTPNGIVGEYDIGARAYAPLIAKVATKSGGDL